MRSRDSELGSKWGTICTPVEMIAADGKKRKIQAANTEGLLRIIQSIPSPKAEPFKLWLAQVGRERIEETIDPEQAIDRALETYLKKGYTEEWVHQRLLAIRIRNDLTAEWQSRGVEKGREFAILTDEITRAWSGMSTRQYKRLKGLKKENLRDNMSDLELVLNMLAEATTTEISRQEQPEGFDKDSTPVGVHMDAKDLQGEQTITVTKVNHHKRSLTIEKKDAETSKPLAGVQFKPRLPPALCRTAHPTISP